MTALLAPLGPDRLGAGLRFRSLGTVSNLAEQRGVIPEARGHVGVLWPEGFLPDGQCPLVQRLGSGIPALCPVDLRQVVEFDGKIRMLRA